MSAINLGAFETPAATLWPCPAPRRILHLMPLVQERPKSSLPF